MTEWVGSAVGGESPPPAPAGAGSRPDRKMSGDFWASLEWFVLDPRVALYDIFYYQSLKHNNHTHMCVDFVHFPRFPEAFSIENASGNSRENCVPCCCA